MLVAISTALPILAPRAIKAGPTVTIHVDFRVSRHFTLSPVETQTVAQIRLAMGTGVPNPTLAFGAFRLIFLTLAAVLTSVRLASGSVGKTGRGRGGSLGARRAFWAETSPPLSRHGDAHFPRAAFGRRLTVIDEILVLSVVLNDDEAADLRQIAQQINRLVVTKFVHLEEVMRLVGRHVEIVFEDVDAGGLIGALMKALDDLSAGAVEGQTLDPSRLGIRPV